jgi:hypothetical protein
MGKWEEDPSLKNEDEDAWVWVPREKTDIMHKGASDRPTDLLFPDKGRWVFWGSAPQFSLQTCLWRFVSKNPRMVFIPDDPAEAPLLRMNYVQWSLIISGNSPLAPYIVRQVQTTFLGDVRFNSVKLDTKKKFSIVMKRPAVPGIFLSKEQEHEEDARPNEAIDETDDGGLLVDTAASDNVVELPVGASQEQPEVYDQLFDDLGFKLEVIPQMLLAGEPRFYPAKFLDLFEKQLSLEISGTPLRNGQRIMVKFSVQNVKPPLEFTLKARVVEIESSDGVSAVTGLEIEAVDQRKLDRFLAIIRGRQQAVSGFMVAAKGGS